MDYNIGFQHHLASSNEREIHQRRANTAAFLGDKGTFWLLFCQALAKSKTEKSDAYFKVSIVENTILYEPTSDKNRELCNFIELMRTILFKHFQEQKDIDLFLYTDKFKNTTLHVIADRLFTREKGMTRIPEGLFKHCIENSLKNLLEFLSAKCLYAEDDCYLRDEDVEGTHSLKSVDCIQIIWNKTVFPNFTPIPFVTPIVFPKSSYWRETKAEYHKR